jgi:hypothetical protein
MKEIIANLLVGFNYTTTDDGVLVFSNPITAQRAERVLADDGIACSSKGKYLYIE